ncbi:MAG: signal peptidase I [Oscillospiraceae bacterium]|nr:signal peptidase I [Oscillospiraceae bacterium]
MSEQEAEKKKYSLEEFCGDVLDILEAGAISVFVFILLFAFVIRPVTVDGGSMNPTLYNMDKLLILTPLKGNNGDIVVVNNEEGGRFVDPEQTVVVRQPGLGKVLIKRVIARAGQEVRIDTTEGTVTVDGKVLDEPYIADPTYREDGAFTYPMTVPEGYIFVMGDNRLNSTDSRNPAVGLIPVENIYGTAVLRYDREDELTESWKDRFAILF